ncbi:MAG: SH3 domain-containing protein [Chloroflexota bacterium]
MSLGERIRGVFESGGGQHGRSRPQAQPIGGPRFAAGARPNNQWLGIGLAAAAAVLLTAILVFIILWVANAGSRSAAATATPARAAATPAIPSAAEILATPAPAPVTTILPVGPASPGSTGIGGLSDRLQIANTDGQGVNLRREPSTTAERIKVVPERDLVDVIGPDREVDGRRWKNVRTLDGDTGWIPAAFLVAEGASQAPSLTIAAPGSGSAADATSTRAPAATAGPSTRTGSAGKGQVGNTGGQGVNIRSEAGGGRVLKTLAEGTAIDTLGPEMVVNGVVWRQVRDAAGVSGWMVGNAVVPAGSLPTPTPPSVRATPSDVQPVVAPKPGGQPAATSAPAAPTATPQPGAAPTKAPTSAPSSGGGATPTPKPLLSVPTQAPTATKKP